MKLTIAFLTVISVMLSMTQAENTWTTPSFPTIEIKPGTFEKKIHCLEACGKLKENRGAVYHCVYQCRPLFIHDISIEAAEMEKKLFDFSYHGKEWSAVFPDDH